MASRPTHTSIYDLPEEVLISIVSHFDVDPPSIVHASEVPSAALWKTLERPTLKNFSLVCQDWRRIAFPILFKYVKIDLSCQQGLLDDSVLLSNVAWPSGISEFVTALTNIKTSVLIYTSSSSLMSKSYFQRIYSMFSPCRLLLVMEPALWWHLLSIKVNTQDAWAFEIPYQSVECRQHKKPSCSTRKEQASTATAPWNLLEFQTWDEMRVHGGNCLTNFGTCMCIFRI